MILSNYTQSRANKLRQISVPEITDPEFIKILWVQSVDYENGRSIISKKRHRHSFFEAHFNISGSITYECKKGDIKTVSEGEWILFSPEIAHTVKEYSGDLVRVSVAFKMNEEGRLCQCLSANAFYKSDMTETITAGFDAMLRETEHKDNLSIVIIKSRILEIICSIVRAVGIPEPQKKTFDTGEDIRIVMIKQYIKDNKNILLTCKDVAEQCHFNAKYINRVFKEKTGETLLEYIHKTKVKDAEELLECKNLSLAKISHMLGFANEYYFNSFFKRYTGIAPGQYRKKLNNR